MDGKCYVNILLTIWMVQPLFVSTVFVLQSLEPLENPDPDGIKLRRHSILKDSEFSKGITFCGRFYFLSFPQVLLHIGLNNRKHFIKILRGKEDENFWLKIGGISFEIKNVQYENNQLWITNQWQHFCLAFSADTFHVSMIKVHILFEIIILVENFFSCVHKAIPSICQFDSNLLQWKLQTSKNVSTSHIIDLDRRTLL